MNNRGFTLLEILIAVAIMAASFTVLLSAQGGSFLSSERGDRLTTATLLARQKMSDLEIEFEKDLAKNKFADEDSEETGVFDAPFDDYHWLLTIKKVEIPAGSAPDGQNALVGEYLKNTLDQMSKLIREVKLTVYWGDQPEKPVLDQPHLVITTHWVKL